MTASLHFLYLLLFDDYTRLLRFVARINYPGAGFNGDYDVDGRV